PLIYAIASSSLLMRERCFLVGTILKNGNEFLVAMLEHVEILISQFFSYSSKAFSIGNSILMVNNR
ncbi:MAG: hypothetical protein U0K35_06500, partial [Prevotella sp.]|nr:hypothetical protein [Prevotella sp.]